MASVDLTLGAGLLGVTFLVIGAIALGAYNNPSNPDTQKSFNDAITSAFIIVGGLMILGAYTTYYYPTYTLFAGAAPVPQVQSIAEIAAKLA